jgi:hypothetical protein
MNNIVLTEKQLENLVVKMRTIKENEGRGSYMSRQQLFTIAKLAAKMWKKMDEEGDDVQLEDWMESKIAQTEQSINSVVNAFLYDKTEGENKTGGMDKLGFDDLIIGQ